MPDSINESIEQAAIAGIASHSVDGESTTAMSVNDQIAAKKFLQANAAIDDFETLFGTNRAKMIPPGST